MDHKFLVDTVLADASLKAWKDSRRQSIHAFVRDERSQIEAYLIAREGLRVQRAVAIRDGYDEVDFAYAPDITLDFS